MLQTSIRPYIEETILLQTEYIELTIIPKTCNICCNELVELEDDDDVTPWSCAWVCVMLSHIQLHTSAEYLEINSSVLELTIYHYFLIPSAWGASWSRAQDFCPWGLGFKSPAKSTIDFICHYVIQLNIWVDSPSPKIFKMSKWIIPCFVYSLKKYFTHCALSFKIKWT